MLLHATAKPKEIMLRNASPFPTFNKWSQDKDQQVSDTWCQSPSVRWAPSNIIWNRKHKESLRVSGFWYFGHLAPSPFKRVNIGQVQDETEPTIRIKSFLIFYPRGPGPLKRVSMKQNNLKLGPELGSGPTASDSLALTPLAGTSTARSKDFGPRIGIKSEHKSELLTSTPFAQANIRRKAKQLGSGSKSRNIGLRIRIRIKMFRSFGESLCPETPQDYQ